MTEKTLCTIIHHLVINLCFATLAILLHLRILFLTFLYLLPYDYRQTSVRSLCIIIRHLVTFASPLAISFHLARANSGGCIEFVGNLGHHRNITKFAISTDHVEFPGSTITGTTYCWCHQCRHYFISPGIEFLGYQGHHLRTIVKSTSYNQHLQSQDSMLSFLAIRDITHL